MNLATAHLSLVASTVLALAAGCRPIAEAPPRPPEGSSAFHFVAPPPAPPSYHPIDAEDVQMGPAAEMEVKLKAKPIPPLANPVYPSALLGRVSRPVAVGVRFTV